MSCHWLPLIVSAARNTYGDCWCIPYDLDQVIRQHAANVIGFGC